MVRYRELRTIRQLEKEFPYQVEVVVPPDGLGRRLDEIEAWLAAKVPRTEFARWGKRRAGQDVAVWGFQSPNAARGLEVIICLHTFECASVDKPLLHIEHQNPQDAVALASNELVLGWVMNDKMALNLITEIMGWGKRDDDGTAAKEYQWLRLMSAVKYDGYADFRAGIRFLETLASWLNQFAHEDRNAAYAFVKERLMYISPPEMQQIIEAFYAEEVSTRLRTSVAEKLKIKPYEVWSTKAAADEFEAQKRKTLFIGMSDGSRIDILRRINSGFLSTEQVLPMLNVDNEKWADINKKLKKANPDEDNPKFDRIYLIEDFTASGTTFIRFTNGEWKGKLKKFNDSVYNACEALGDAFPISGQYALHIHHYVSSYQARKNLKKHLNEAQQKLPHRTFGKFTLSQGLLLPKETKLQAPTDEAFLKLCDKHYLDKIYRDYKEHCDEAGQTDMRRGYADCALPIILDHNTPNNSVPLLWADVTDEGKAMRALFRRRHRHG